MNRTCLYSPVAEHHRIYSFSVPLRVARNWVGLPTLRGTHPWAWRRVTSLIDSYVLALSWDGIMCIVCAVWCSSKLAINCIQQHLFNGLFSLSAWTSWHHQKVNHSGFQWSKKMVGWQWHQLDYMQTICTSLHTDNHVSTSSVNFIQAGCCSWRPTNGVKTLKALNCTAHWMFAVVVRY